MLSLFKRHPIAAPGFVIALACVLFFAVNLIADAIYWNDPEHRRQTPEAWMTPRYIAHSWQLDPKDVGEALGMIGPPERGPDKRPTLSYIAEKRGVPVEQVIAEATDFVTTHTRTKGRDK